MKDEVAKIVDRALEAHSLHGRRITIALSGGMDSVVLLDILHELRASRALMLSAVHVNHRISPRSGEWENFCRSICRQHGIPLTVERVDVVPEGEGIEAVARRLRHGVYSRLDTDCVALAHHADDQAETILLQLLRGAGPQGLSGMPMISSRHPAVGAESGMRLILRPLLNVRRSGIQRYAQAKGLAWVEDDSNADSRFDRNFLRNEILVRLEPRFPAYRETLARTGRNMADYANLARDLARMDAGTSQPGTLSVQYLKQLTDARALNLLRLLFSDHDLPMPPRTRLEEALRQCRHAGWDAQISIRFGNAVLCSYRNVVRLVKHSNCLPSHWYSSWDGTCDLLLPDGLGLLRSQSVSGEGIARRHFDKGVATVRGRNGGERMRTGTKRPRRALRNLLQEHAIAPWDRNRMPMVFFGESLAWVPGVGVAAEFRADPQEVGIAPVWERG